MENVLVIVRNVTFVNGIIVVHVVVGLYVYFSYLDFLSEL